MVDQAGIASSTAQQDCVRSHGKWTADASLFVVALVWGTTFVLVKQALTEISTLYFLALRFSVATVCMLPLLVPIWRNNRRSLWPGLAGGATAGVFLWLGYTLQTFGLKYTTAGNSGFLTGIYVPLVPLIGAVIYRRRPQRAELAGVLATVAGMLILMSPSLKRGMELNFGDLLTVGCAVAFAFHLLLLGHFSGRNSFGAVAVGQIACTALLSFLSLTVDPPVAHWSREVVIAIAVTGVFATALAFALQTWAQRFTSATRTAVIFSLEPVFALITAVLLGGEALTAAAVGGGALILAGILIVELKPFSPRRLD